MGLRINTNIPAQRALRLLQGNDGNLSRSLERLSTGLRINRAADDPAGLIISEQLRAQVGALGRAIENSQNASNMLSTVDAAMQEMTSLLSKIQSSLVFVQNTGGITQDQIAAEQAVVDQNIAALDRIAQTTRFAGREMLNGTNSNLISNDIPSALLDVNVKQVTFAAGATSRNLTVTVSTLPERGTIAYTTGASAVGSTTIRITGPRGTADIVIASGTQEQAIASAINGQAQFTGVFASSTSSSLRLFTQGFGDQQSVRVEILSGILRTPSASSTAGDVQFDRGVNGQVTFEGQIFTGVGEKFSILTGSASFDFGLNPNPATGQSLTPDIALNSTQTLTVARTGLTFQLNEESRETDRLNLGMPNLNTTSIGLSTSRDILAEAAVTGSAPSGNVGGSTITVGGFVNSIKTGSSNSLSNNPSNALSIVKAAINQVARTRAFLGGIQAGTLEPNIVSLGVHQEQLSNSVSFIRDVDFAQETSAFTRYQILFQSSIAAMAAANITPQSVLALIR